LKCRAEIRARSLVEKLHLALRRINAVLAEQALKDINCHKPKI